jgi:plastocyanin
MTSAPSSGTAAIVIQNYMFSPNPLHVGVGTKVTTTNHDSVPHTWTADNGAWDSGQLEGGKSYTFTFTKAGTYSYHCNIHSFMTGSVVVS